MSFCSLSLCSHTEKERSEVDSAKNASGAQGADTPRE